MDLSTLDNASESTPFGKPSKAPKQRAELVRQVDYEALTAGFGGPLTAYTEPWDH